MTTEERAPIPAGEPGQDAETPEVYAVRRRPDGWSFDRRRLLAGAGAAVAATATVACGLSNSARDVMATAVATASTEDGAVALPTATAGAAATPAPAATTAPAGAAAPTAVPVSLEAACTGFAAHMASVHSLVITPDGALLATAGDDKVLKRWDLPAGGLRGSVECLAPVVCTPAGTYLVTSVRVGEASLIAPATGNVMMSLLTGSGEVTALAVSANGKHLVVGDSNGGITDWALSDGARMTGSDPTVDEGTQLLVLEQYIGVAILGLAVSPDGMRLASGDANGGLKLWDIWTGSGLVADLPGHDGFVYGLAFTPDGSLLASAGKDGIVRLWSTQGELVKELTPDTGVVLYLAFNPAGTVLACSGQGKVTLWSLPDGEAIGAIETFGETISPIAISPDGKVLACGNQDGVLQLCSLDDVSDVAYHPAHTGLVSALAFSPDGSLLFSGGQDGAVKLWAMPDGELRACLADLAAVSSVARASTYSSNDTGSGGSVTYTLPCGSAMPAGAVCVCNCVAGSAPACGTVGDSGSCSCDTYAAPCDCDSYTSGGSHYWYPN
ncbi:MAG: WD40 repeat domain-containing protein [Anaerolineae bacterium]